MEGSKFKKGKVNNRCERFEIEAKQKCYFVIR